MNVHECLVGVGLQRDVLYSFLCQVGANEIDRRVAAVGIPKGSCSS